MRYFLSVDGGGTKTLCLVADGEGRLLGIGQGGPANANFIPIATAERSITEAVRCAWQAAGPPPCPPTLAGISGPIPGPLTETVIVAETRAEATQRIPEGQTALQAALPWSAFTYGVAVGAGTGAIAYGFNRAGQEAITSGWGALLGDEGGGYWIAVEALRAITRAADGREPPTRLTEALLAALGIGGMHELIPVVYQRPLARHEIAALCPVVARVAREGDPRAQAILRAAAQELALAAEGVIRRLGLAEEAFAMVPFGSVFKAGDLLLDPFRAAIHRVAPRAEIIRPRYEPVVGGLLAVMRAGGVELNETVLRALEEHLRDEPLLNS